MDSVVLGSDEKGRVVSYRDLKMCQPHKFGELGGVDGFTNKDT